MNPAVTLSLLATRRLDVLRALVYVAAQCLGACLGASALYLALPVRTTADHFVNRVRSLRVSLYLLDILDTQVIFVMSDLFTFFIQVPAELNAGQALGIEVLCTFQMVFTVFSVEDQRRRESPEPGNLAIGLAHTAGVMIGVMKCFIPTMILLFPSTQTRPAVVSETLLLFIYFLLSAATGQASML